MRNEYRPAALSLDATPPADQPSKLPDENTMFEWPVEKASCARARREGGWGGVR
jgi:hypothetical protein